MTNVSIPHEAARQALSLIKQERERIRNDIRTIESVHGANTAPPIYRHELYHLSRSQDYLEKAIGEFDKQMLEQVSE